MIDYFVQHAKNPLSDIKVDLGTDKPLVDYVIKAICGLQVINQLRLYPIEGAQNAPRIEIGNWKWNPHPSAEDIQIRRRETGTKIKTKTISDNRIGILEFDIYCEARDKNKNLESDIIHNMLYIPIEDERGCYLLDNNMYSEYQLVDKLLYPSGKNSFTLKSLLPVVIRYEDASAVSTSGYVVESKVGMVKIFTTMEPILSCFMHIKAPLSYLGVFPILQFCDRVLDDEDQFEYFQPNPDIDIYIKGYREGMEKFEYVKTILVMSVELFKKYKPKDINEVRSPEWWVYQLSYYDNIIEHRGACHQMHVARMLDTISAQVLPIPEIDKRNMIALLRYVLETEFDDINVFSYENKRLRKNEVVSTIITAIVSDKLKGMFKFGVLLKMSDMQPKLKFSPDIILRKMYELGTVHVTDFSNDLDYYHQLRFTRKGQTAA